MQTQIYGKQILEPRRRHYNKRPLTEEALMAKRKRLSNSQADVLQLLNYLEPNAPDGGIWAGQGWMADQLDLAKITVHLALKDLETGGEIKSRAVIDADTGYMVEKIYWITAKGNNAIEADKAERKKRVMTRLENMVRVPPLPVRGYGRALNVEGRKAFLQRVPRERDPVISGYNANTETDSIYKDFAQREMRARNYDDLFLTAEERGESAVDGYRRRMEERRLDKRRILS